MSSLARASGLILILVFSMAAIIISSNPASGVSATENSWTTVTNLPTNVTMGYYITFGTTGAAAVNGQIYCFAVITQWVNISSYVYYHVSERYDLDSNTWTAITPPTDYYKYIVACENRIYSIGGGNTDPNQVYSPSTDSWDNISVSPTAFPGITPTVVGSKIFFISGGEGGFGGSTSTFNANYVYDTASDSWLTATPIPTPVEGYASAVLDGKIYIIGGGTSAQSAQAATSVVQIFDPESNQWSVGTPLPYGVEGGAACATSGLSAPERIYVVGGNLGYGGWDPALEGTTYNQIYDPTTRSWSMGASLPEPRYSCTLINVNDSLFAIGGVNGTGGSVGSLAERVVLDIDKYSPTGYATSLSTPSPSITSTPSSSTPTASPTPSPSPSPSVPEFSWLVIVPLLLSIVSVAVILKHRKTAN